MCEKITVIQGKERRKHERFYKKIKKIYPEIEEGEEGTDNNIIKVTYGVKTRRSTN